MGPLCKVQLRREKLASSTTQHTPFSGSNDISGVRAVIYAAAAAVNVFFVVKSDPQMRRIKRLMY